VRNAPVARLTLNQKQVKTVEKEIQAIKVRMELDKLRLELAFKELLYLQQRSEE
jgi:hypothetical protein